MKFKNPFHRHKWEEVNDLFSMVRSCKCGKFQTHLYDQSVGGTRWINGLLTPKSGKVVIFAGSFVQFRQVEKHILETTSMSRNNVIFASKENIRGLRNVDIYFHGNWWDNPDYQDDVMTFTINRLLHS